MAMNVRRIVALASIAPVPALIVGAIVAHQHGVAWQAFTPNAIAVVLGVAMIASMLSSHVARFATRWLPLAALALIAATLISPGLDGVHRWLSIPGFRLHSSMALAAWTMLPLALTNTFSARAVALVAAVQVVHLAQPDGGQAMALAAGCVVALLTTALHWRNAVASLVLMALASVTWMRPDPLAPVDHVERILHMIGESALSIVAALAAGLCLVAPLLFTLLRARDHATRRLVLGFIAMIAATFVATFIGNFPVPVFGAGASGVLGWYSMVAALVACARR